MKANRKFITEDEDAVSPVIAVILMVAITVVLAATVYVWVSGFSGNSGQAAKSISLTSMGPLSSTGHKNYTIASATSGMKWSDLKITVNGAEYNQSVAATNGVSACPAAPDELDHWIACAGSSVQATSDVVDAGDVLRISGLTGGQTLRILDSQANSIILTLTIG